MNQDTGDCHVPKTTVMPSPVVGRIPFEPGPSAYLRGVADAEYKRSPLNDLARDCHAENQHWWQDPATGEPVERNIGELLALVHSEVSECLEGVRKSLMDDHLPHRRMEEVEAADIFIRLFDIAGKRKWDLDGAVREKRAYNQNRSDHKPAARLAANGKKF